jgi:hypothetical protein
MVEVPGPFETLQAASARLTGLLTALEKPLFQRLKD